MIREINIKDKEEAKKVLEVQIPSYMVEAELIDFYDIPPLKDTVHTLQKCGETFYGYFMEGELSGAVSFKTENKIVDIHRLIVHPKYFRKGIAQQLLNCVEQNHQRADSLTVTTGLKNLPAVCFYEKNGFKKTGVMKVGEHLEIISFKKEMKGDL